MTSVVIRHRITDMTTLITVLASDHATRRAYGELHYAVFQNATNPEDVMIVLEWDDPHRAQLYAQSDDAQRMLGRTGLADPVHLSVLRNNG
ncbi:MAG TPA: hypothetical protein VGW38_18510 [Chloroflexota bacterium]|nr:hypothetical protein [Chloroflexota bacterium]